MGTVTRNILANYLGTAWTGLMGFAFIPLYVRFLGIEAYGVIGIFAVLQSVFMVLDMGMGPTLGREAARFQAGAHSPQAIRELVHAVERVYWAIAIGIAASLAVASPWLAGDWLRPQTLATATIAQALMAMGVVIALRWLATLYRSSIQGLQDQVWLNVVTAGFATLRGVGVIPVLAWLSPTIQAFFIYQAAVTGLEALVLAVRMRHLLPAPSAPLRFRWQALRDIWRFAAGMSVITVLAVLLTQADKVLLSRLLPLREFGHYALASTLAAALYVMVVPLNNAIYPRLTELVVQGDQQRLAVAYHRYCQALTLAVVPAALVLALFADHLVLLWTRDAELTRAVAPLVSLLVIGNMLNGLMHLPYSLQLAHGWTRLAATANLAAVVVLVPAIYFSVKAFGVIAAPVVWITLNSGYVALGVPLMHRKLLGGEMWRWYGQDVLAPTFAALAAAALARAATPAGVLDEPLESVGAVLIVAGLTLFGAALASPLGRSQLYGYFRFAVQLR
ncbi:MAG: oligosaccharide flippase family protein [Gammaproteobacteria bacterium]|nr:oligosaccharide flippase family protein [Gammaproteobacteria bacterium]